MTAAALSVTERTPLMKYVELKAEMTTGQQLLNVVAAAFGLKVNAGRLGLTCFLENIDLLIVDNVEAAGIEAVRELRELYLHSRAPIVLLASEKWRHMDASHVLEDCLSLSALCR